MSDLKIFENTEFGQVRMVEVNGKPYAVGVDVAKALEYANPSKAVIDHCKGVSKLGIPSAGGVQETNVIPEGDIYRLISKAADQSKNPVIKEKAERFESWLFDEVLPSIRANGSYSLTKQIPQTLPEALRAYADEEFPGRKFGNKWIINHQLLLLWAARVEKRLWPDHLKGAC